MSVSIYAGNFNKDNNVKETSINYKENVSNRTNGINGIFNGVVMSEGQDNSRLADNTYESLLKEADDVKQQIMNSASTAQISFKALVKKLSGMEAVDIAGDGFNITDASKDDMVSIIDKIRIELAMHSDSYVAYGTGVSSDAIESVAGAGAANELKQRLSGAGISVDDDTVKQVQSALDEAASITELSESAKYYMIANDIAPTIDGIYKAENAVSTRPANSGYEISFKEFNAMRPQIESLMNKAGLEVNLRNLNNAQDLINNNIPVTEKTLKYKAVLDGLNLNGLDTQDGQDSVLSKIADQLAIGEDPKDTPLTNDPSIWDNVKNAIVTLANASYDDIVNVVSSGKAFTISSLKVVMQVGWSETAESQQPYGYNAQKAYNTLVEARLLLTAGTGVILEKSNTSLLYTPLEQINEQIKALEANGTLYAGNTQMYNDVLDVRKALYDIETAPAQMYEKLMKSDPYKLSISMVSGIASGMTSRYAKAIDTYETTGTKVREDLDDSIIKAVNNSAEGIMDELNLENTQENRDVIKLLASNNIDINKENVERARRIYTTLNNLVDNMKPETVVKMIDDGINPMNTDIWTVNDYLSSMNQGATKDNEEKYSKFLYKLDKTGGINETKKKQFIGIYQMMNIFTRDAGVCAGALMKQGKEITMGNLISAYTSRKHSGIDVTIDDSVGLGDKETISYFESLFAKSQKFITPNTLKNSDNESPIEHQNVEAFANGLAEHYDEAVENELDSSYIEEVTKKAEQADAEVVRELRRAGINENIGNINAVNELMATGQLMAYTRKHGNQGSKSIYGENIIDSNDKLKEVLDSRDKLEAMYTNLEEAAGDELEEAIESSLTGTAEDPVDYDTFEELRISNRQIRYISNLARRNDYRVPYVKNGQAGLINLTFVADDNDKGKISIKMNTASWGELSVEAKVTQSDVSMYVKQDSRIVLSEDRSIYKYFQQIEGDLKEQFGYDNVRINCVRVPDVKYTTYEDSGAKIPSDRLYKIASAITGVFFGA